jgi:hypothetical protein
VPTSTVIDGSGTARTWRALIKGLNPPLVSESRNVCDVPDAVNVPMANWPSPPTAFVVFASSVTELVARAVVFVNAAPKIAAFEALFVHHWTR